jgi:hypothetical protein
MGFAANRRAHAHRHWDRMSDTQYVRPRSGGPDRRVAFLVTECQANPSAVPGALLSLLSPPQRRVWLTAWEPASLPAMRQVGRRPGNLRYPRVRRPLS